MSEARPSDEGSARSLIGVRTSRDAQIVLVQSAGHRPERGEPAVVEIDGQPTLAVVEIPAALILSAPDGAGRGELIAHGASDPRVRDFVAQRDVTAGATAQAVLGQDAQVSSARLSLDGAWVTIHLVAGPTLVSDALIDRLARALQAAIRVTMDKTDDTPSAREVSDVPDALDGSEMGQAGQDNQYGKFEPDD